MANNTAIVGRLTSIRPIEGADKIRLANVSVFGVTQAQVVVGLEEAENTPVVYFTSNMCLNDETFTKYYGEEEWKTLSTYLGRAGRVRTVKLRGVYSDGLVVELEKFKKFGNVSQFIEGYEFLEIDGKPICKKYEPPVKAEPTPKGDKKTKKLKKFNRLVEGQFHFHYDTDNLRRNAHKLNPYSIVSISEKWHGTSAVVAHVPVKKILGLKEKVAKFFGVSVNETEYDYLYSSRTVVKNASINLGEQKHFYGYDLWTEVGKEHFFGKLNKGESVYYEIVGFTAKGGAIQARYPYGCKQGEHKIAVYRITVTNVDGVVFELPWNQMLERCKELDVSPVETLFYGQLGDLHAETSSGEWESPNDLVEFLEKKYLGKKRPDCNGQWDEGIVVRVDHLHQAEAFKLKDYGFLAGESEAHDKGAENLEDGA